MKIGILGGSFNPPHFGHINISDLALKKLQLDQIWWIPTAFNPLKNKENYTSLANRIAECEKLISNHPKIFVKKFDEIYTVKLIERLKSKYQNINFYWLMGADNIEYFHLWKNFKKIIGLVAIAIFSRDDHLKKIYKSHIWQIYYNNKLNMTPRLSSIDSNSYISNKNNYYHSYKENLVFRDSLYLPFNKNYKVNFMRNNFTNIFTSNPLNIKNSNVNILPKILIFRTKNFNISSSQIRNKLLINKK